MSFTTIRGMQLRDATLPRSKIDAAFESQLAGIEANIVSIFNTMSTDAERMAAVDALTVAFQNADGTLQGMITTMVNQTKAGAGLEADGSFVLPVGQNFLTGASTLKAAIGLLDAALKTEQTARIAADAALQTSIQAIVDAGATQTSADLATETAARIAGDSANATAIANEVTARQTADADLQTQINNEVTARTALNTTLSTSIANEANARTQAVSDEATARAAADTALQNALDAESLARTNADTVLTAAVTAEVSNRIDAVSNEAAARSAADTALDGRVSVLETSSASNLTYSKVVRREIPAGVIDGVNKLFTLAYTPVADTEEVFYNGQLLEPGATADYTISGKDITLSFEPLGTDRIRVSYFR